MAERRSTSIKTVGRSPEMTVFDAKDEVAANRASLIALAMHACLAFLIVVVVVLFEAGFLKPRNGLTNSLLLFACCPAQVGSYIFLTHCIFLLPSHSSARIRTPIASNVIAFSQFAIFAMIRSMTVPSGAGKNQLGILFAYFVGLCISGWFLHRIFGASLSMGGKEVYQGAFNTKVLLAVAPLLLVMGLIPILVLTLSAGNQAVPNFAPAVVVASLILLVVTAVPILSIYAFMDLLRPKGRIAKIVGGFVLVVYFVFALFLEVVSAPNHMGLICISIIVFYFAGIATAIAPFYWCGFRPVWAKRKQVEQAERAVFFDEVI